MQIRSDMPDPLGIRAGCRWVQTQTDLVTIDDGAVERIAEELTSASVAPLGWPIERHWIGNPRETANWLLVLDAVNFSFWGEPRWRVEYAGTVSDGYWALVGALVRAEREGRPLHEAVFLARLSDGEGAEIFRGIGTIPLLAERVRNLREVGAVLLERWEGQFLNMIEAAAWRAPRLVELVVQEFPSFRDEATLGDRTFPILKRAQILAADVHGAFSQTAARSLSDLEQLTAFADYKVPQVLRALGALRYRPDLARRIDQRAEIPPGSPEEVAIRAGTIVAIDEIAIAVRKRGVDIPPYRLDWYLWDRAQHPGRDAPPYHLTRTTAY